MLAIRRDHPAGGRFQVTRFTVVGGRAWNTPRSAARTPAQEPGQHNIAARLTAADPANTGWQRDLQIARQRLDDLPDAAG